MSQQYRLDHAGAWLHVVNRGVAKRTIFTTGAQAERFLDLLGLEVASGLIEIHALALLTTHFHLFVRSVIGQAYRALMRAQNVYARAFNREMRRDGPLFRGRFHSSYVSSDLHWRNVVRYIDFNAVDAGLAERPEDYRFATAAAYLGGDAPAWLSRDQVYAVALANHPAGTPPAVAYRAAYGSPPSDSERHCVEARLKARRTIADPLDDLVGAAPEQVQEWMRRKALLADGTCESRPVARPATVVAAVSALPDSVQARAVSICGVRRDVRRLLLAGLLRRAAGCTWTAVGEAVGFTAPGALGLGRAHERLVASNAAYRALAAGVLSSALSEEWPDAVRSGVRAGRGLAPVADAEPAVSR